VFWKKMKAKQNDAPRRRDKKRSRVTQKESKTTILLFLLFCNIPSCVASSCGDLTIG
jgi:hypothetical protein